MPTPLAPTTVATPSTAALKADANNRAVRSSIQGLFAVLVFAVGSVLQAGLSQGASPLSGETWRTIGTAALTAAIIAATSYAMRRWGDPSGFPTPLPPAPAAEPAAPGPGIPPDAGPAVPPSAMKSVSPPRALP